MKIYTNSLLSKWGFNDGDLFDDFVFDNELDINEHKFLLYIVKKYILPKLNQKVKVLFMETIHNPVRAKSIDGQDYSNWYDDDEWEEKLTPKFIEINEKVLLEEAKKFIK